MTMDIEKAERFFLCEYKDHQRIKGEHKDGSWYYNSCYGDHGVSGYEFDVDVDDDGICYSHKIAAEILGLPVQVLEKSPPRTQVESSFFPQAAYGKMILWALQPSPITRKLSEKL